MEKRFFKGFLIEIKEWDYYSILVTEDKFKKQYYPLPSAYSLFKI